MTNSQPFDPTEVAAQLRVVLAAAQSGEIEARPEEIAYMAGAADAMERVAENRSTETTLRNTVL